MKKAFGIIGFGNMGSAIGERIKSRYQVFVFDKDQSKTSGLSGILVAESSVDLVNKVDILLLAIKPQDFGLLLNEIKGGINHKLIISIAAGIATGYIEKIVGEVRVVRVMPNIAAKIGEAESVLCKGKFANDSDLGSVKELFNCVGKTWVMEERMIDAATAISGSGPAYIYYDMEINKIDPANVPQNIKQEYIARLSKAAEKVGFNSEIALGLASATCASTISLAVVTAVSPAELRRQVTSKGGTTEAALKVLAAGGSWEEAAEAAKRRAGELSEKVA